MTNVNDKYSLKDYNSFYSNSKCIEVKNVKKKKILLDVDEVICFSGFLDAINDFLNTNYTIDEFEEYYIDEKAIPKDRFDDFCKFVIERNLYENPYILPNSIEVIKKLNDVYDLYICSSCINPFKVNESGRIFKDKYEFLIKALPFIKPERYIFTSSKDMINAEIIIDDRLCNLESNVEIKILFPSYHNTNIKDEELKQKGVIRAGKNWRDGWSNIEKILL